LSFYLQLVALEAVRKLKPLPQKFQSLISPILSRGSITLSELITLVSNYQSEVLAGASGQGASPFSGARALSHDWFYVFQQERPYMQRDFFLQLAET
jgi:hypothetical protein